LDKKGALIEASGRALRSVPRPCGACEHILIDIDIDFDIDFDLILIRRI